ncbi:branched-chain amino acid transport system II carrier protein [Fusobacterium sp. PH5-44]|uniref:branched-chain amino acid transport system II carrier protein n=1 Tax=unclassified Fusobacterium TaxID=2648384 RepID=UPI003D1F05F4
MQKNKNLILTGFALFAMLFGAGNLIFPPEVGIKTGTNWIPAAVGFIITGAGLPLLGILASSINGEQDKFASKVSSLFDKIFNIALVISIGPLLALPRTGAVSYEIIFSNNSKSIYKILFLGVFFLITFLFSIKSSEVVDRIGKILTPILIIMLVIIIAKGIISPLGTITKSGESSVFRYGFVEGYQTMDALAAIIFANIIVKSIREKSNLSPKEEFSFFMKSGVIAVGALAVVYGGLIYIGATSESLVIGQNLSGTELLSYVVHGLLGNMGKFILSICVVGACLTTSIGLATSTSECFSDVFKIPYKAVLCVTVIVSFVFSYFGVNAIRQISVPVLVFLYPIAMVLIILNLFKGKIKNDFIYKGAVLGAGMVSLYEGLGVMDLKNLYMEKIYSVLPLVKYGLAWLLPSIICAFLFSMIKRNKN